MKRRKTCLQSAESKPAASTEPKPAASGKKTPEGLARSTANAITHGFTGRTAVLMDESKEAFQKLREAYLAEIGPQSRIESDLVDQLVVARWRLERIWMIETGLLDLEMTKQREEVEEKFEAIDEEIRTALAFRSLCDGFRTLALLNPYEARIHCISAALQWFFCQTRVTARKCRRISEPTPFSTEVG